jgi:hypothetical protein
MNLDIDKLKHLVNYLHMFEIEKLFLTGGKAMVMDNISLRVNPLSEEELTRFNHNSQHKIFLSDNKIRVLFSCGKTISWGI